MHEHIIEAMVQALTPALKGQRNGQRILQQFWRDKIALIWDVRDVHTAANQKHVALTNKEALTVLKDLHRHHDKELGLRWEDLTCYIGEYGLGRKLTGPEQRRFANGLLTLRRQRK